MLQLKIFSVTYTVLTNNIKATGPANDQMTWWEIQQLRGEYKQSSDPKRSYCMFSLAFETPFVSDTKVFSLAGNKVVFNKK